MVTILSSQVKHRFRPGSEHAADSTKPKRGPPGRGKGAGKGVGTHRLPSIVQAQDQDAVLVLLKHVLVQARQQRVHPALGPPTRVSVQPERSSPPPASPRWSAAPHVQLAAQDESLGATPDSPSSTSPLQLLPGRPPLRPSAPSNDCDPSEPTAAPVPPRLAGPPSQALTGSSAALPPSPEVSLPRFTRAERGTHSREPRLGPGAPPGSSEPPARSPGAPQGRPINPFLKTGTASGERTTGRCAAARLLPEAARGGQGTTPAEEEPASGTPATAAPCRGRQVGGSPTSSQSWFLSHLRPASSSGPPLGPRAPPHSLRPTCDRRDLGAAAADPR